MAEDKKSFILYCDIHHTVLKLTDEQAGKLFKHILAYVNDENPVFDDILLDVAFEPIKQSLKRDLKKWERISLKRAEIGRLGGLKSAQAKATNCKQLLPNASKLKQTQANQAVSDSVSVSDNEEIKRKSKNFDLSFVDEMMKDVFNDWISYKKERKEMYKTQKSLEICYNNLIKFCDGDPAVAREIVNISMGNNYQGLFPLKNNLLTKTSPHVTDY